MECIVNETQKNWVFQIAFYTIQVFIIGICIILTEKNRTEKDGNFYAINFPNNKDNDNQKNDVIIVKIAQLFNTYYSLHIGFNYKFYMQYNLNSDFKNLKELSNLVLFKEKTDCLIALL